MLILRAGNDVYSHQSRTQSKRQIRCKCYNRLHYAKFSLSFLFREFPTVFSCFTC